MEFEHIYRKLQKKQYIEVYTDLMFFIKDNPRDSKAQIMLGFMEELGSSLSAELVDFITPESEQKTNAYHLKLAQKSYRKASERKDIEGLYNEIRIRHYLEHKPINNLLVEYGISNQKISRYAGSRGAFVNRYRLTHLFHGETKLAVDLPLDSDSEIMYQLATQYMYDLGSTNEEERAKFKPDMGKGIYWLTLSAERGFPEAMSLLGFHYHLGLGVKKDVNKALEWHQLAAEKEVLESVKELIDYYVVQPKEKRNDKQLLDWIMIGVKKEYDRAFSLAGEFHLLGRGTKKDPLAAIEFFRNGLWYHDYYSMRAISDHFATDVEKDFRLATYWWLRYLLRKNEQIFSTIFY